MICTTCGIDKSIEEFYKEKLGKLGIRTVCKSCMKKKVIANRQGKQDIYKDKTSAYYKKYRKREPISEILRNAKQRAKQANVPFSLTIADIRIPEFCPLLNVRMERCTQYSPSIDRIIPSLGYVKENIVIVSKKANTMKSNATLEELRNFSMNAKSVYNL